MTTALDGGRDTTRAPAPGPRRVLDVHPGAWWLWALALAVAATSTTSPLLLLLIVAVACLVVALCRTEAPWALSFRLYLVVAAVVVVLRVAFRIVFGTADTASGTVLLRLPELALPESLGLTLFGDVTAEALLGGFYDGLRLATLIVCVGAANALANPKRLLKAVPGALAEVSTAVVVTLSVFPQLVESVLRVSRARRLRGGGASRHQVLHRVAVPVLEDALERSLLLAAAMDSRGYGRSGAVPPGRRRLAAFLVLSGLVGIGIGVYGVLDLRQDQRLGRVLLLLGCALAAGGMVVLGRVVTRTRYRPDRWTAQAFLVIGSGVVAAYVVSALGPELAPLALNPPLSPLTWPSAPVWLVAAILLATLPAWLTPGRTGATR